ncbi:MAG: hypothetical protein WBA58_11835 [Giesbergeria sp.]
MPQEDATNGRPNILRPRTLRLALQGDSLVLGAGFADLARV